MHLLLAIAILAFVVYSTVVVSTAAGWRLPRWPEQAPRERCWHPDCRASFLPRERAAADTEAPPSGLELHERAAHNPEPIVGSKIALPVLGAWRQRRQLEVITANGTRLRIVRGRR